jgi:hypothetical protein
VRPKIIAPAANAVVRRKPLRFIGDPILYALPESIYLT